MSNVTMLHLALILLLAFSLFGLAAELLYLLHCRRRRRRCLRRQSLGLAVDPELQGDSGADNDSASSKWTLLRAICFKKQPSSRVEPTLAAAASPAAKSAAVAALAERDTVEATAEEEEDEEECDLTRWREMCLGPSRALYTIQEEEDAGHSVAGGDQEARHSDDDDDCDSDNGGTPFYTPASSPPRASEEVGKMPPAGERREV